MNKLCKTILFLIVILLLVCCKSASDKSQSSFVEQTIDDCKMFFVSGIVENSPDSTDFNRIETQPFFISEEVVSKKEWAAFIEDIGYVTEAEKNEGSYIFESGGWTFSENITWKNVNDDSPEINCVSE
jgi:hypothetical protein